MFRLPDGVGLQAYIGTFEDTWHTWHWGQDGANVSNDRPPEPEPALARGVSGYGYYRGSSRNVVSNISGRAIDAA